MNDIFPAGRVFGKKARGALFMNILQQKTETNNGKLEKQSDKGGPEQFQQLAVPNLNSRNLLWTFNM